MKHNDRIIMSCFSAFQIAATSTHDTQRPNAIAAYLVTWCETPGPTATYFSETWNQLAPDMWLATSQKNSRRKTMTG